MKMRLCVIVVAKVVVYVSFQFTKLVCMITLCATIVLFVYVVVSLACWLEHSDVENSSCVQRLRQAVTILSAGGRWMMRAIGARYTIMMISTMVAIIIMACVRVIAASFLCYGVTRGVYSAQVVLFMYYC